MLTRCRYPRGEGWSWLRDQRVGRYLEMNVVCFGDSIMHAAEFSECNRWPNILQRKLDVWRHGAFTVFNRGIGGNTSARGFDRLETDVIPLRDYS